MKGILGEGVLPGVMREIYVSRKSGLLMFQRGDERRGLRFCWGHIVHADTNVREDRMGEVLLREGRLTAADLKRATGFVLRDHKRLGHVLVELGMLKGGDLEDLVALHVRQILSKVFSWTEGTYDFKPEQGVASLGCELTLKISTGDLILEAARSVADPDVVRYYLGDIDRVLGLAVDPLLRFQRLTLTPADGYVLSRVDGTLSAREVVAMIPTPSEETHRSLFGLLSTGMVEYLPLPARPRLASEPVRASARSRPQPAPVEPPRQPPPAAEPPLLSETESPEPAESPEPPTPSAPGDRAAELGPTGSPEDPRRMEILEKFATVEQDTHFQVLGLPRNATNAEVKEAYFRLAKRFHPDVHHDPALADLRDKIETIFVRLGEAYEVLRNPRIRARYETQVAPVDEDEKQGPVLDAEQEARLAAMAIRRAARSIAEEHYWEAIHTLEPAILRAEGQDRQEGRLLLARAYMKNVNWVKQGEELLLSLLGEEPANVEAHLLLGQIYRERGLKARATSILRKAVELDPDNAEAREQLASLGYEGERSGGLLRRLFPRG
jgi:DnaJ domain/Domain of unknown function (DUF4388)/Tetratricopeptide repeat